jgi:hypothetical protein
MAEMNNPKKTNRDDDADRQLRRVTSAQVRAPGSSETVRPCAEQRQDVEHGRRVLVRAECASKTDAVDRSSSSAKSQSPGDASVKKVQPGTDAGGASVLAASSIRAGFIPRVMTGPRCAN